MDEHASQAAVGGPSLAPAPCSPSARAESVPKSGLEIFGKRWADRASAVDDVQHMAYGVNKRLTVYSEQSGSKRVVLVCPARLKKDVSGKKRVDGEVPCKVQAVLLKSKAARNSAAPWPLSEAGTTFDHTSCGEDSGHAPARMVKRLASFTGALQADKGATKEVMNTALRGAGVTISKSALYRARGQATSEDEAAFAHKFQLLEPYCQEFNKTKANGYAEVRFADDGKTFSAMTIVFRGMAGLVQAGVQHVSFIDMAHSKSNLYTGQHFAMVGAGADNKVSPMAWGVCPIENATEYIGHFNAMFKLQSGEWHESMEGWMDNEKHTQIADRMKGIPLAQGACMSSATRMACTKHLIANARATKTVSNKFMDGMVWAIQGATTEEGYKEAMVKLTRASPTAATFFEEIEPALWCLWPHIDSRPLFGHRTSNFVEGYNAWLLQARSEGPLGAADKVTAKVMADLSSRRRAARERHAAGHLLTKHAQREYDLEALKSARYEVLMSSDTLGFVTGTQSVALTRRKVDLAAKTCSCGHWFQKKIPCRHAIRTAKCAGLLDGGGAEKFKEWIHSSVHPGYRMDKYLHALERAKVELVDVDKLEPDGSTLPSVAVKQAGRPRKKRLRAQSEDGSGGAKKHYKCGKCGGLGHNQRHCTGG